MREVHDIPYGVAHHDDVGVQADAVVVGPRPGPVADRSATDQRPRTSADAFTATARYVRLASKDLEARCPFGILEIELFNTDELPKDEYYSPFTTDDWRH